MRHSKFCPKCGKDTEDLHEGLCSDCFKVKIEIPKEIPDSVKINACKVCEKIFVDEKSYENEEAAIKMFLQKILGKKNVDSASYRISGSTIFITMNVEKSNVTKEMQKNIPIIHKKITCKFCAMRGSTYYNSTIQIRVPKSMEEIILNEIDKIMIDRNKHDDYAFISKVEKKKEGIDVLVGSKSAVRHVVKYLKSKYKITTKMSSTLYGPLQGKKTYRDTVLISMKKEREENGEE